MFRQIVRAHAFKPRHCFQFGSRQASTLVLAEIDSNSGDISAATRSCVTAMSQLGHPITALILGDNCSQATETLSKIKNISKVLKCEHACLKHPMPESFASQIATLQNNSKY